MKRVPRPLSLFLLWVTILFVLSYTLTHAQTTAEPPAVEAPYAGGPQLTGAAWSPYLVGALIGLLSMLTFYFSNKPLGTSTAYALIAGKLGRAVAPAHTNRLHYYKDKKLKIDWQVLLVGGVVVGALIAAALGGEITGRFLPQMWEDRFGPDSVTLRALAAFAGGLLMAFGARMAGGCTSGHGISGTLQLSVGSWITVICMFAGGIVVAMMMFAA